MAERKDLNIFVASSDELMAERNLCTKLLADINKSYKYLRNEPLLFEVDLPGGSYTSKEALQNKINRLVDASDIVIVFFWSKVGKYTKMELDRALAQQKKVFLLFKKGTPKSTDPQVFIDYADVLTLRNEIKTQTGIIIRDYENENEFYTTLYRELSKYFDDTFPAPEKVSALVSSSNQLIPLAPRPYIAHPYALSNNFTGRTEELKKLTEWLKYDTEPMCIVEAIGGMGKSALTWKWLQEEVITKGEPVEGIIWWSFYDQGFDDFIRHLYEYCIPEDRRKKDGRTDAGMELINALANHRCLLVLDGFERVLRGYAQMMAMYIQEQGLTQQKLDAAIKDFDIVQRTPIFPFAEKLLKCLCAGATKTLMTTRLYPATIEGLVGVKHMPLTGLSKTDTIAFFKAEGITGSDEEMVRAGVAYNNHPLMLKLLSTSIKRSFTKNIGKAFNGSFLSKKIIDEKEPQKILATSYNTLSKAEQKVASTIAVFRTAFKFEAAKALFPGITEEELENIMMELSKLGFVMYNEAQHTFDLHPIMRSYLYDTLTDRDAVHERATSYFKALPGKEKIVTLADLEPVIEQYHHLVRAKRHDDAFDLYTDRFSNTLFYQLAQYEQCIELCQLLFAESDDTLPKLTTKRRQSYILNQLGLCYALAGQLDKAGEAFLNCTQIDYANKDGINLGSGFRNLTELAYLFSDKVAAAALLMHKAIPLSNDNLFDVAYDQRLLADSLTIQSRHGQYHAQHHLDSAMAYFSKKNQYTLANFTALSYARLALLEVADGINETSPLAILEWAMKTIGYAERSRTNSYPKPVAFLNAYEAIGRGLLAIKQYYASLPVQDGSVLFYDEHFQEIRESIIPTLGNYFAVAERAIQEGMAISRKINRVFNECTFSLLQAQALWLRVRDKEVDIDRFLEAEQWINDTHALATKIGYRQLLAELHLFCAECLIEMKELNMNIATQIMSISAAQHLEKAREYARDTSEYNDLFLPEDGSADEFYKGIPGYKMLKRGMTEKERIKNGYYAAWLIAERLEQRLTAAPQ